MTDAFEKFLENFNRKLHPFVEVSKDRRADMLVAWQAACEHCAELIVTDSPLTTAGRYQRICAKKIREAGK